MNITYDKKKWMGIIVLLVIAILSFSAGAKYAAAPEHHKETIAALDEKKDTVLELTVAATATSALITLIPGDVGTPIAEKVADLSGYLLIVLCAVFLEKYLVTLTGYAAFKLFIPAACVLFAWKFDFGKPQYWTSGQKVIGVWHLHFSGGSCQCEVI